MMTLDQLKPGQGGTILKVGGEERLQNRLYDYGLLPNTFVIMRRTAPLGGPVEITLRGYDLSLRQSHAKQIQLKEESLC